MGEDREKHKSKDKHRERDPDRGRSTEKSRRDDGVDRSARDGKDRSRRERERVLNSLHIPYARCCLSIMRGSAILNLEHHQ
jgi:hypothetical protein